jgi:hypothetical protein
LTRPSPRAVPSAPTCPRRAAPDAGAPVARCGARALGYQHAALARVRADRCGQAGPDAETSARPSTTPGARPHTEEYAYYPQEWRSPYMDRRRKVGWDLYALLGIGKADKQRMHEQHARNYDFFGAPVGLIFTIDRVMQQGSWLDYGMFLQNLMVAARARGWTPVRRRPSRSSTASSRGTCNARQRDGGVRHVAGPCRPGCAGETRWSPNANPWRALRAFWSRLQR